MNDVLNDKAWLEKMMYIIRINQLDNRFGRRGSRGGIWGFIPPQFFGSENYLKCLS